MAAPMAAVQEGGGGHAAATAAWLASQAGRDVVRGAVRDLAQSEVRGAAGDARRRLLPELRRAASQQEAVFREELRRLVDAELAALQPSLRRAAERALRSAAPGAVDRALRDPAGASQRVLAVQLAAVEGAVQDAAAAVLGRIVEEGRYRTLNAALLASVERRAAEALARVEVGAATAASQHRAGVLWVALLAALAGAGGAVAAGTVLHSRL